MSGLAFLSAQDFKIIEGQKGPIMCTDIQDISLILFYSTNCHFCAELLPIFKTLPGTLSGCQFGMINVSKNKDIVRMAKTTIAPITYVPMCILYYAGRPYMRYEGPNRLADIQEFIVEVAKSIQSKKTFEKGAQSTKHREIPAYTIGKPKIGERDDVFYLEYDQAYQS